MVRWGASGIWGRHTGPRFTVSLMPPVAPISLCAWLAAPTAEALVGLDGGSAIGAVACLWQRTNAA